MTTTTSATPIASTSTKLWANSADSHFLEPPDLWTTHLPPDMAARVPHVTVDPETGVETIHLDGMSFERPRPNPRQQAFYEASHRPPGARDARARLADLDAEGIWGELVFPSLGMWNAAFTDPVLLREAIKVSNDWAMAEIEGVSKRLVVAAQVPLLDIDDAIAELHRIAAMGAKAVFLPTTPPRAQVDYHREEWEPFWAAAEEAGIVIAFHIGTDPIDMRGDTIGVSFRGPGGAVLNYVETTYSGQRAVTKLVASGALDRHPTLKVLVAEGGATWVPFLGDRMNEGYRQHAMMVRPQLSVLPKEILYRQVYASFQHDESAIAAMTAMGYRNVCWGSDYPHLEGTFGHTQETLHQLFDGVDPAVRERITRHTFLELFPEVGEPPTDVLATR
jgi:predicted TIM-barrel fold metal-dependent hydrolase